MKHHRQDDDVSIATGPGRAAPLFVADAFYMALVYLWTLGIPPLGRDYAMMARPDAADVLTRRLFTTMMEHFGSWPAGYRLVNLLLLYGCMALLLTITRRLTRGPWWLGSVAAVLFMANAVKTEAVLNISGARELLPAFCALCAVLVYAACLNATSPWIRRLPLAAYLGALLTGPTNIMVFAVFIVLDCCCGQRAGRMRRLWPTTVVGVTALLISGQWAMAGALNPARMFAPLYLALYPIGLLPDTVALFTAWPWSGYGLGLGLAVLGLVMIRKVNNPVFRFGLVGAVAARLFQGGAAVDPVTLAGGGQLLLPVALLSIAAAGFFHDMLKHPQWRPWAVRLSTLVCVAAMIVQGWVNLQWLRAGSELRHFQNTAEATFADTPDAPVALVPDIQYYRMAPLKLSASLRYDTPFSKARPVVPLMPLSLMPPAAISVDAYSPRQIVVTSTGLALPKADRPTLLTPQWWRHRVKPPEPVTLEITAQDKPLPETRIPYPEMENAP